MHPTLPSHLASWATLAPPGTHLVGGTLRDRLLGRSPVDFDWSVPTGAHDLARRFADATGGHCVHLDAEHDVARVLWPESPLQFDIARQEGADAVTDLRRRDLTLNALGLPLDATSLAWLTDDDAGIPAGLLDPTGGLADLQAGRIRAVSESNLLDDPLRLLRAFRFASQTGFAIEPATLAWISRHAATIAQVAPERVAHESYLLFAGTAGPVLAQMQACGFLIAVWPEMAPMITVPPNDHHHLDVLSHSVEVAHQMEQLLTSLDAEGLPAAPLQDYLDTELAHGRRIGPWLKAAALWHDLGKPATYTLEGTRARFTGHDKVGADIMTAMGERLRLSTPETRWLAAQVGWHLRPGHLLSSPMTDRALYRFYRDLGRDSLGVSLMALADRRGTQGPAITAADNAAMHAIAQKLVIGYLEWAVPVAAAPPLVDGRALMAALDWQPGRHVGEMLVRLREAQALGEILDAESAVALAKQWLATD
ncbi:MAG: CCA tRNA nucleotidyltransferase [Candidatus Sericytochromatia bacterium]|nr:CCA tRNA nucleotidyltransferase [Candidatus Sericytochromatia bacterium]